MFGIGLPGDADYPVEDALDDLADDAEDAIKALKGDQRDDDAAVETALSRTLKRASQQIWDRRPVVEVTVLRI